MKCLVTGAGGFIGSYLVEYLLSQGQTVYALVRQDSKHLKHLNKIQIIHCDILDQRCIREIIREIRPERVFHLASQTLVKPSWEDPELTLRTNVFATLYLLNAIRETKISPLIEVVCSSSEYATYGGKPITEDHLLEPSSPYALSKLAQDYLAALYWRAYMMSIIRLRPFFIIGPRKSGDVCSDFARGIVAIERRKSKVLNVGNLDPVRDLLDVRDAVIAFWLIAERGHPGEVYNICSGKGYRVQEVLERLISISSVQVDVYKDPACMRYLDEPVRIGDNGKLQSLGWTPRISINETLSDILAYWRAQD
jgi:GDP-4-dehydro-6-deoxy-D-mannose reductase